jgi:Zn-dependent protease
VWHLTGFALDGAKIVSVVIRITAILLCLTVHEVCHGLAAYALGDPTAKSQKRLSLNPIHHLDPFGTLMMLVAGFGWAKPVPVDPRYFRKPKSGMALTALAGPVSNFVLAFFGAICLNAVFAWANIHGGGVWSNRVLDFLYMTTALSIGLAIFNLIPFPPLDGSKIVAMFLSDYAYGQLMRYERYGMLLLMAALWLGWLDRFLVTGRDAVLQFFLYSTQFAQHLVLAGV